MVRRLVARTLVVTLLTMAAACGGPSSTDSADDETEGTGGGFAPATGGGSGVSGGTGGTTVGSGGTTMGTGGTAEAIGGALEAAGGTTAGIGGAAVGIGGAPEAAGGTTLGAGGTATGAGGTTTGAGGTTLGAGGTTMGTGGAVEATGGTTTGSGGSTAGAAGALQGIGGTPEATGGTPAGTGGTTPGTGGTTGDDPTCEIGVYDGTSTPQALQMSNVDNIHDPTIVKSGDRYYVFNSGIFTRSSTDLRNWVWGASSTTLKPNPSWTEAYTEGPNYDLWAPDASYFGGQYHLYFAASSMNSQTSCLGHATRSSMESGDFTDSGGPILCSNVDTQVGWNAIDPNVVFDAAGAPWLVFGSGWDGIEIVRLVESTGEVDPTSPITNIARNRGEVIEGATMVYRCGYYYLFLSWGLCCRGADSTYTIRVGRSTTLDGGFVDKDGVGLLDDGGTLLVSASADWAGPGGESVLFDGTDAYLVYHAYDAHASGNSFRMHISELFWDDTGWPVTRPTPP